MLKSDNKSKCRSDRLKLVDHAPEKDVELCLEVEMDDEVKEIIASPEKYASTLLDVTVIKPKDLDKLCSQQNTMTGEAVRKFIASMNLDGKQTLYPGDLSPPKSSGDHSRRLEKPKPPAHKPIHTHGDALFHKATKIYTTDDTNSEVFSNRRAPQKVKQVYAAPKTFHEQIKANFECKKNRTRELNEKLNAPCLCHNCAIVGVVTDAQKKPFATENMYDPREPPRKRKPDPRESEHAECQYYFRHLSDKIKHLEARIAVQEEKTVPKDYFRRIITKLVTHITKLSYGSQVKLPANSSPKKVKEPHRNERYENQSPKFIVNPILVQNKPQQNEPLKEPPKPSAPANGNQSLWRWGEEILKPGIDLKKKIILLMEDTLSNLKRTKERTREEEIKNFVNEFSSNLYKTVHETPERDKPREKNAPSSESNEKNRKRLVSRFLKKDQPISVDYINSKVLRWQDTETTFKFESSDMESVRESMKKKTSELYRAEFTKTLLNTKNEDKVKLWRSIWNQASANGQSKSDKVTIQLPDKRDPKNKIIEIMYALGDLEKLLLGKNAK